MPYQPPGVDPFTIPNPDPTRHYRWLSDDPRRLAQWLRGHGTIPGYRLVDASEAESLGLSAEYVNEATGRIRYGFNVLASIPREEAERRIKERIDEQLEKVGAAKEGFFAAADSIPGVTAVDRSPAEHFDRKEFAQRPSNNRTYVSTRKNGGNQPASSGSV